MLLVGVVAFWAGYTLTYFGWESLRGPGVGLLDLVVPGRFKGHAAKSAPPPPAVAGKSSGLGAAGSAGGGAGGGGGGSW